MNDKLLDLRNEWEESVRNGCELSIVELTADCPELADELQKEIDLISKNDGIVFDLFGNLIDSPDPDEMSAEDFGIPEIVCEKFKLIEHINSGSFGDVWKAEDLKMKRLVALKFPSSIILQSKEKLQNFVKEAEIQATFQHPNVVSIYELGETESNKFGVEDKCPFIVMELMDSSLVSHITDWVNVPVGAANIILPLVKVLESAHNYKTALMHRDIKPNNILIKQDNKDQLQIKLADFGLSTSRNSYYSDEDLKLFGAIGFIPPERLRHEPEDVRGDIYSLGVIFYILITGDTSFVSTNSNSLDSVLASKRNFRSEYAHPATVNPILSDYPEIVSVCLKAIESKPCDRYNNAKEFASAIENAIKVEDYDKLNDHISEDSNTPSYSIVSVILIVGTIIALFVVILWGANELSQSTEIKPDKVINIVDKPINEDKNEDISSEELLLEIKNLNKEVVALKNEINRTDTNVEQAPEMVDHKRLLALEEKVESVSKQTKELNSNFNRPVMSDELGEINSQIQELSAAIKKKNQRVKEEPVKNIPSFEELDLLAIRPLENEQVEYPENDDRIELPEVGHDSRKSQDPGLAMLKMLGGLVTDRVSSSDSVILLQGLFQAGNDVSTQVALNTLISILNTSTPGANEIAFILPDIIKSYNSGSSSVRAKAKDCLRLIIKRYKPTLSQQARIDEIL